jgi:triacylglycerol lipase
MGFMVLVFTLAFVVMICLDISNKIRLTHLGVISLFLIIAPHIVLWGYLIHQYTVIKGFGIGWQIVALLVTLLFFTYIWMKLNILPVVIKQNVPARLKIMMGGRSLTLYGLFAGVIQIVLCIFGFVIIRPLNIPPHILIIDVIITILTVLILFSNGILRILCTSRRLSIIRRIVVICTIWIPILNFLVLLYACHIVKQEYDHECYKVVKHNIRVDSQICTTKYPLVMVHGVGFQDLKYFNYWGRIPKELIRNGANVYYGNQEAWGTVDYNAHDIKKRILEIIEETGCGKVNIIAHSKGGLDARYAISMLDMGDCVASLTTMSTPHRGSKAINILLHIPDGIYKAIGRMVDKYYRFTGDKNPDFYTASRQFSTNYSAEFNEKVKDAPQVYYQSYASVMKNMFSDSLLAIPHCIVKSRERENDGLVCIDSAKWGEFKGVFRNKYRRGISHGDIIDLKREDYKGFDVIEKYVEIVAELKQKGY